MASNELKQKLHKLIDEMDDEATLTLLYEDAVEYKSAYEMEVELTPEQIQLLEKAEDDIQKGNFLTHEEVIANLRNAKL